MNQHRSDAWHHARATHKGLVNYDQLIAHFEYAEKNSNTLAPLRVVFYLRTTPKTTLILTYKKCGPMDVKQIEIENRFPATGETIYLGSIDREGILRPASTLRASDPEFKREVWRHISALRGEAPSEAILENGKMTGICCFCNRELSDPDSIARGCGPDCAKKYNIPLVAPLDLDAEFPLE